MDTLYWKTLIAVAEAGNFSKAADRLCVTQSAVSRRVLQLEQHYGCALVDRSGPVVGLTNTGNAMVAKAREILALETAIDRSVQSTRRKSQVAFANTRAFGIVHLPRILQAFMLDSDSTVQVSCSIGTAKQIVQCLQDGGCDLAVIDHCPSLDLGTLASVSLPDVELAFVCSPDLEIPSGATTLRQLLPHTLIVRSNESCSRGILDKGLGKIGLSVDAFRKVIEVDDLNLTLKLLREGGATTFISRELLASMAARQAVTSHMVPELIHVLKRTLLIGSRQAEEAPVVRLQSIIAKLFAQCADIGDQGLTPPRSDRLRLVRQGDS